MKKILLIGFIVFIVLAVPATYFGLKIFGHACSNASPVEIRIHSNWTPEKLASELMLKAGLDDESAFIFWLNKLGYKRVKPCFITIPANATIYSITQILKSNRNQTRNIVIKGGWDAKTLAETVSANVEVSRDSFLQLLTEHSEASGFQWDDTTWPAYFIPNTYNFFVADGTKELLGRMQKEYEKFWSENRRKLAENQGLSPYQVSIIASIVSKESNMVKEYENIAGVYINRLRKGMLLQADPTVVFARGKSGRVWSADLRIHSPYNTYIHKGLPPGPICIPNLASYEAVLNYTHHDYLYFCAKEDFSGYHNFAATLAEHNANARKLHKALDERGR